MYRTGHLGASLLAFAPLGYLLLAAGHPLAALVAGGAMLWLTMLPDVDHRLPVIPHRGPTHSLLFGVAVGGAFAGVGYLVGAQVAGVPRGRLVGFGFLVGFVAVAAHLLADVLTPAGVNLFWPLSEREYSLSLARADNAVANVVLFLLGVFAVAVSGVLALRGL